MTELCEVGFDAQAGGCSDAGRRRSDTSRELRVVVRSLVGVRSGEKRPKFLETFPRLDVRQMRPLPGVVSRKKQIIPVLQA
mgnify:CR=1 FL=1